MVYTMNVVSASRPQAGRVTLVRAPFRVFGLRVNQRREEEANSIYQGPEDICENGATPNGTTLYNAAWKINETSA